VVVGFSFATEVGWAKPSSLTLISVGPFILLLGVFYESRTTRDALFPLNLILQLPIGKLNPIANKLYRSIKPFTASILLLTFLHNVAFTAGTYYLAIYFQVGWIDRHATPLLTRHASLITSYRLWMDILP
jgi:hypothetical protein